MSPWPMVVAMATTRPWIFFENMPPWDKFFQKTIRGIWILFSLYQFTHHTLGVGWGCEVSCGGHHRPRGKTATGSALDGAVFDFAQILAYLVHNMSRSQYTWGLAILADSLLFSVNNILAGLWLNCISSVEITLFLLADILLQHRALCQC